MNMGGQLKTGKSRRSSTSEGVRGTPRSPTQYYCILQFKFHRLGGTVLRREEDGAQHHCGSVKQGGGEAAVDEVWSSSCPRGLRKLNQLYTSARSEFDLVWHSHQVLVLTCKPYMSCASCTRRICEGVDNGCHASPKDREYTVV